MLRNGYCLLFIAARRKLALERGNRLLQHAHVSRRSRRCEIGPRASQRELNRSTLRPRFPLLRGQSAAKLRLALLLGLLELDVLAFEASRHTTTTVFYRHAQRS